MNIHRRINLHPFFVVLIAVFCALGQPYGAGIALLLGILEVKL